MDTLIKQLNEEGKPVGVIFSAYIRPAKSPLDFLFSQESLRNAQPVDLKVRMYHLQTLVLMECIMLLNMQNEPFDDLYKRLVRTASIVAALYSSRSGDCLQGFIHDLDILFGEEGSLILDQLKKAVGVLSSKDNWELNSEEVPRNHYKDPVTEKAGPHGLEVVQMPLFNGSTQMIGHQVHIRIRKPKKEHHHHHHRHRGDQNP